MCGCIYRTHIREMGLVPDKLFSGDVYAVDTNILSLCGKYMNMTRKDQDTTVHPGFNPAQLLFKDLQVRMIVVCCESFFLEC